MAAVRRAELNEARSLAVRVALVLHRHCHKSGAGPCMPTEGQSLQVWRELHSAEQVVVVQSELAQLGRQLHLT